MNNKNNIKNMFATFDKYRIFIVFIIVFIFSSIFAPNFFNVFNLTSLMKASSLYAIIAIGMTITMICGHLDLSVQAIMNFSAVLTVGFHVWSNLGWGMSVFLSVATCALIGMINGILITKAKIHSFITTLGMMTIVSGLIFLYSKGGSISAEGDLAFGDFLEKMIFPILTPRIIITIVLVLIFSLILGRTRFGRNLYLIGGNKEAARHVGINVDLSVTVAFIISAALSALSGSLFSISQGAAVANMGSKGISPLMVVISSVIIGGTSMSGGKGGVFKSYIAVLTLMVIFNALTCFGTGYEIQVTVSGLLLAFVVLFESIAIYRQNKMKGIRPYLLEEAKELKKSNSK